jgi:aryl-alcohol dehydrogenase-like predicted oxidoreductase
MTVTAAGTFALADLDVTRMGFGAMQLAGPGVFGPPADHEEAVAVLRAVVAAGVTHLDTSDYYGPHVTNRLIREALAPYPDDLVIVTKVGARRDEQGGWPFARAPHELRRAVEDNLENLGLDRLDVVNLRMGGVAGPESGSIAEPFEALAALQDEGLIRHLGLSTVDADQIEEAQRIAPVVCVQNHYNIAHRTDDALVDDLAAQGIAYVPYFPLGGFSPLQSDALAKVAADLGESPLAVALAWLLQRSPNMLLIPGTSSRAHLEANLAAGSLVLPEGAVSILDGIAG